jgi:hypothetical protein
VRPDFGHVENVPAEGFGLPGGEDLDVHRSMRGSRLAR